MASAATASALLVLAPRLGVGAFVAPSRSSSLASASRAPPSTRSRIELFAASDDGDEARGGGTLFFADDAPPPATTVVEDAPPSSSASAPQLFDAATLAEANDALTSVGWAGVAPSVGRGEEGEMTSDDPFVRQIDESVRGEVGVGLDELLNPAKVVNLERDLYNLRSELARLTGATVPEDAAITTELCDAGGGGEEAEAVRTKIAKKEKDLSLERRSVFRGWLKGVFLGQAVLSTALSYVMATHPEALFGGFPWFNDVSNMDTSIKVLGFWWWWLFIVPSLRSRRPTGKEKKALDLAFVGTPLISLLSPIATKDTGIIWMANFAVVAGAYAFAFLGGDEADGGGDEGGKEPGWLKFIYKSLDFGSGRERGARN
ncbi:hypothetical protein ACHAWF_007910 [Thalassiosira exigua]